MKVMKNEVAPLEIRKTMTKSNNVNTENILILSLEKIWAPYTNKEASKNVKYKNRRSRIGYNHLSLAI